MTKRTGAEGRLDIQLTPKDWGVRLAEAMNGYSVSEFREAYTLDATPSKENRSIFHSAPHAALAAQAKGRFPGEDPRSIKAYKKEVKSLFLEFDILKMLLFTVNEKVKNEVEIRGLLASLKLSTLQTSMLLDAFKRTAEKAISWVKNYTPANTEEKENRKIMLKELASYTAVDLAERFPDRVPLWGGVTLRAPSVFEEWIIIIKDLLLRIYSFQQAIELVQKKYFNGKDILLKETREGLQEILETVCGNVETYINYLGTRRLYFGAEWNQEEAREGISSAIPGEQEGQLFIDLSLIKAMAKNEAKILARTWLEEAKRETSLKHANADKVSDIEGMLKFVNEAHSHKGKRHEG